MAHSYSKSKGRKDSRHSFAGIPRNVMATQDYKNLSGSAVKLLLELANQYKGKNKGDLSVAYSTLKNRGFNAKSTITRAVNELLAANLIIRTREGSFINPGSKCALSAISWQPIDECPGKNLCINPTSTPPRKFSLENIKSPGPGIGPGSSSKRYLDKQRDHNGRFLSSFK